MKINELLEAKAPALVQKAEGIFQMEVPFADDDHDDDDPEKFAGKFAKRFKVHHKMTKKHGPSGGWPEFLFWGPRSNMEKFAKAYSDGNQDDDEILDGLEKSRKKYDPTVFAKKVKVTEAEEAAVDLEALASAIAKEINNNGTRIFDIEMYEDDVLHFAIEFDFAEGLIKGADVKKVSKFISKVGVQKAPDWRHGQTGADYMVTLKSELSDADGKKLVAALKKAVK